MLLLKLAIRNILRQKRRSFLTGISMALGLVMAAVTLSVVEGSYGRIVDGFTKDRTGHVQIHAFPVPEAVDRLGCELQSVPSICLLVMSMIDARDSYRLDAEGFPPARE